MFIRYCDVTLLVLFGTIITTVIAKYRLCAVDGKGGFQNSDNHCPKLQTPESRVECVKGFDRFDCLRKIRKGIADFSIFTPEDLIAASNTENDVLITNELRISESEQYREQIVAVVSDASGIKSAYDLEGKILCHPGYEVNGFVSEVLTNFLESTVVRPQACDVERTVPENRILSSSRYFKSACKPGPWVNDPDSDRELKLKYPNLCKACSNPLVCSKDDKYYGSGSLLCLKDGAGDLSWTTYKQVRLQFDLDDVNRSDEWTNYKFLCKDNTVRPLNSSNPCTWAAQPWAVVAANRKYAADIQKIIANITHTSGWEGALLDLLEVVSYHVEIYTMDSVEAVDSYLSRIPGYLNANSFTGCHPPRTIRICTTSIPAQYKCGWMREAAAVHGLEPDIDCLKADNATHCMEAIQNQVADVVIVHPDFVNIAEKQYDLKALFYETVEDDGKYLTIPVVSRLSKIKTFEDLKGKRACFPMYDGVSWNTVIHELRRRNMITTCPYEEAIANFFDDSCVPNIPSNYSTKLGKLCQNNKFTGDEGALDCLKNGIADVAFVSQNNLREYAMDKNNADFEFRVLCDREPCHLSWSPAAQAFVSKNTTIWRNKDIIDVFFEIDNLFGRKFKDPTRMFTMYGEFDGKHNILFNDKTVKLEKTPKLRNYDNMPREYEELLKKAKPCNEAKHSSSIQFVPSRYMIYIPILSCIFRINIF